MHNSRTARTCRSANRYAYTRMYAHTFVFCLFFHRPLTSLSPGSFMFPSTRYCLHETSSASSIPGFRMLLLLLVVVGGGPRRRWCSHFPKCFLTPRVLLFHRYHMYDTYMPARMHSTRDTQDSSRLKTSPKTTRWWSFQANRRSSRRPTSSARSPSGSTKSFGQRVHGTSPGGGSSWRRDKRKGEEGVLIKVENRVWRLRYASCVLLKKNIKHEVGMI